MSKALTPKELTVKEQRNILKAARDRAESARDGEQPDTYSDEIFEDISLHEIAAMCDASIDDLDDLTESQLENLRKACLKANPRFFAMKTRDRERIKMIMEKNPALLTKLLNDSLSKSTATSESLKEGLPH